MNIGLSFYLSDALAIGAFVSTLLAERVFFHRGFTDEASMRGKTGMEEHKQAA
jgi:hypothetical protein